MTAESFHGGTVPAIDSRAEFQAAILWGLDTAMSGSTRRIVGVDRNFADWPLNDPALLERLALWLRRPQRQLVLLGVDFSEFPRRHSRFVSWRHHWLHVVPAFAPEEGDAADLPTVLLDNDAVCVRLIDAVHWRGSCSLDRRVAQEWRDRTDATLQRSVVVMPGSVLGL